MNRSRPQSRQIREREQAEDRPQLRLIRVREQSMFASSPRQQARQQSVRSRDQGAISTVRDLAKVTDMDTPQTDRDSELIAAGASPQPGIARKSAPGTNRPPHHITVAISPLTSFSVHIRTISKHVRI